MYDILVSLYTPADFTVYDKTIENKKCTFIWNMETNSVEIGKGVCEGNG